MSPRKKIIVGVLSDFDKNKNYKSIINKISNEQKKRDNATTKYKLRYVCIFAIILCSVLLLNISKNYFVKNNPNEDGKKDTVYLNKIKIIDDDFQSFLDTYNEFQIEIDSLPVTPFVELEVPDDLKYLKKNTINYQKDEKNINESNVLKNYQIHYSDITSQKTIIISFSKKTESLNNYKYISKETKQSIINEMDVQIFNDINQYIALFKYNDYYFDIRTSNISEIELINLIKSIIM